MATSILIVDDSKLARIVVGKAVTAMQPDWAALEACNADEAMQIDRRRVGRRGDPRLQHARANGLDLAEELRQRCPDMPIAVVTANVQDEVIAPRARRRRGLRDQADDRGRPARRSWQGPRSSCEVAG